jgi:hypothetical protein
MLIKRGGKFFLSLTRYNRTNIISVFKKSKVGYVDLCCCKGHESKNLLDEGLRNTLYAHQRRKYKKQLMISIKCGIV